MAITVELKPAGGVTASEMSDLAALTSAVYPSEEVAEWAEGDIEWSPSDFRIFVRDEGLLVTHVAVVIRQGAHDGRSTIIGGIGGVKTHPDHRGRGYARLAIGRAMSHFVQDSVDFGLLVCEPRLFEYYGSMGWRQFPGTLLTLQRGESAEFTFNDVMVIDVGHSAPDEGVIDLQGPPW